MAGAPVKPYEGNEPYIFISYSHRDSDRVLPILRHLADHGFRLWYDEGIDPGSEWPESIATHLANSKACIAFISANSLASQNCRREINFALSRNHISFLSVMLEDAQMTPGVELQLSTYQSLLKYKYQSDEIFFARLEALDLLQPCRVAPPASESTPSAAPLENASPVSAAASNAAPQSTPSTAPSVAAPTQSSPRATQEKPVKTSGKPFPKFLYIVIPAAVVVLLAAILIPILASRSGNDTPTEARTTTTAQPGENPTQKAETTEATGSGEETEPVELALTDNIYDFIFQLDDVYQLPCPFTSFTKNGWTISSAGYSDETELAPGETQTLQMVMNGVLINIGVINAGTAPCAIKDSQICVVDVQRSYLPGEESFRIACGISGYSSKEEVVDALGPVYTLYTGIGYQKLTYGTSSRHCTVFLLQEENPGYNHVQIYNYPEPVRKTVTELSDDLGDFSFLLDGTVYQLPVSFSLLKENGWTIATRGISDKTLLDGYSKELVNLSRNGSTILVQVLNPGGNLCPIAECVISQITVDMKGLQEPSQFQVAKGITVSSTAKDLTKAFGEGESSEYSNYTLVKYGDPYLNGTLFYIYGKDTKYNKIQLTYEPEEMLEFTMTITDPPEYLSAYKAPSDLGDDLLSGMVRIGGDLYQLPAPVSVFLQNGWEVTARPGFVAAHKSDSMQLRRDGLSLDITVTNFSEYQTLAENCAVTGIMPRADNGVAIDLPKGLSLGVQEAVVKALDVNFNISDNTKSISYYISKSEAKKELHVRVLKETGTVDSITLRNNLWNY